jgi:FdhD protein
MPGAFLFLPPSFLPLPRSLWYIPAVKPKIDALILKVNGDEIEGAVDEVAAELPVRLVLNGEPLVTLLCTPTELEELAVGFLLSEGLLHERSAIKQLAVSGTGPSINIELSGLPRGWEKQFEKRTISSGCGKGITFTNYDREKDRKLDTKGPVVSVGAIRELLKAFRNISKLYLETGGVHSAALSDGKDLLFFSEDIGRHNAVDKLIGKAFLKGVSIENKLLITSGRVTSEIVTKAGRNRFPILISRAAASCMAINYAEDMGITLVGFARGDRMNIYTWPNRIGM